MSCLGNSQSSLGALGSSRSCRHRRASRPTAAAAARCPLPMVLQVIDTDIYEVVVISPRNHFLFTPMLPR